MPTALAQKAAKEEAVDPITAQIIINRLCAIPNLIDKDIARTAFSPVVAVYKDYAVGILDADAKLVAQCKGGLPIFVANALSAGIRDGLKIYGKGRLRHGDVVITNYAGTMGQHLNNVVMYTPIRTSEHDDGLVGFSAAVVHWVDVGGIVPGSCMSSNSTDIFQEGIQLNTLKLFAGGERVEEMYRIIAANTRFPDMVFGDMEAQVAGCFMGRDMVLDVVKSYGRSEMDGAIAMLWDRSERATREVIRNVPDGVYRASSFLDNDSKDLSKNIPIEVAVRVHGDEVTVDLSGLAPQMQGPLNAGYEGGAVAAARIACKFLFSPDDPANDGAFRPIKVECPPGTMLSAGPTAAMGSSGHTIPTVVDTILRALAPAFPTRVPAAHHGTYASHVIHGRQPGGGGAWFRHGEAMIGGWGAGFDRDGPGPFRSYSHGDSREVPVEYQESQYPYFVEYVRLRQDSAGAGQFRGSLGVEKCYRILAPCRLVTRFERTQCPPWGLNGGQAGKTGRAEVHRAGAEPVVVLKDDVPLLAGDRVKVFTGGGGGYGDPRSRDPERIRADVAQEYISRESARLDYGFSIEKE